MGAPRLPDELIGLIIQHLSDLFDPDGIDELGQLRDRSLARCCLVARAFLPPARARLYELCSISFLPVGEDERGIEGVDEDVPAPVVQCAWSTAHAYGLALHPHLALLVRRLAVHVDFRQVDTVDEFAPGLALATALRSAPGVTDVDLILTWGVDGSSYIPHLFNAITIFRPPLRRLQVEWQRFEDDAAAPVCPEIYPLFTALPLLEVLTLEGLFLPSPPTSFSGLFHLKCLTFTDITGPGRAAAFTALTSPSSPSLSQLVIDSSSSIDLSPFMSLDQLSILLQLDPSELANPTASARAVRTQVAHTLALAPPSLRSIELLDPARAFPASAFDGAFFAQFPRSVRELVMEDLAVEPEALLRVLERRPKESPRLALVVVRGEMWQEGEESAWARSFREQEVLLAFAGENEAEEGEVPNVEIEY